MQHEALATASRCSGLPGLFVFPVGHPRGSDHICHDLPCVYYQISAMIYRGSIERADTSVDTMDVGFDAGSNYSDNELIAQPVAHSRT